MFEYNFILPFLLYAETHYSFKGVYSRLKKKEPEIIADAPHRVDPGVPLPIMLLFKDTHLHPVELKEVQIEIIHKGEKVHLETHSLNLVIKEKKYAWLIFNVERRNELSGLVQVDVRFEIITNGRQKIYRNDNYRISSHRPLDIYLSTDPLPGATHWYFGDMHSHSSYTEDQAEFGAPMEASAVLCHKMGLRFFAATDHSYDLDDLESSYLHNDPELKKWYGFQQEVGKLNERNEDFIIIPGEEVSGGNKRFRNVHLLVLNNKRFIPGKGDGAEKWFRTRPDFQLHQIMDEMDENALAIAAHPEIPAPFLEWLLIRRGKWDFPDYQHPRLSGMQIWNGLDDDNFRRGIQRWVALLLTGKKIYIFAGNDAHGNFNRFRQIGFPFLTLREQTDQIFGKMRTGLKIENEFNLEGLMRAIGGGNGIITNGPFVEFRIENAMGEYADIGGMISGDVSSLKIMCRSSVEFGTLMELSIFYGDCIGKKERLYKKIKRFQHTFSSDIRLDIRDTFGNGYIRLELISFKEDHLFRCLTNPVWIG